MDAQLTPNEVTLSPIEINTIEFMVLGYTEKEIAAQRGRSTHTVRRQVRSAMEKTGSHKQTDLVRWWFESEAGVDLNPLRQRIISLIALAIIVSLEFAHTHDDFTRVRRSGKRVAKTARIRKAKRSRRNELETYYLTA